MKFTLSNHAKKELINREIPIPFVETVSYSPKTGQRNKVEKD